MSGYPRGSKRLRQTFMRFGDCLDTKVCCVFTLMSKILPGKAFDQLSVGKALVFMFAVLL